MSEKYERNRRFAVAVLLAAIYGMKRFTWREIFAALKMMLIALTSRKGRASDELYEERMATCRECPLFFSPLATCGSPLAENPGMGCWCQLEKKARAKEATCWMRTHTDIDGGWTR